MARIKQTISAAPGITVPIIVVLYKTTAPNAEYARLVIPTPHNAPYTYEFASVDPAVYNVVHYSSSDGSTLQTLLKSFSVDAVTNQLLSETLYYLVDGAGANDPVSGTDYIIDPYLNGKTVSAIFKEGFRFLRPTEEWAQVSGGRINLLNGLSNNNGEVWTVFVQYSQVLVAAPTIDAFSSVVTIPDATKTLDSSHFNKTVLGSTTANKQVFTLPTVGSTADQRGFVIFHDGGNAVNLVVKASGTEVIRHRGVDKNQVVLGIGECIKIIKLGSIWRVMDDRGQWDRVGEVLPWNKNTKFNAIPLTGTEYDLNVYVRLKEFVDSLDSSQIVTYSEFDTPTAINGETVYHKRGFFARDLVNNKVKVPDFQNMHIRFLKNIGGIDTSRVDNVALGYQHHQIGPHKHTGIKGETTGHGSSSSPQSGNVRLLVNTSSGSVATIANSETGIHNDGGETVERNIGMIPMLLI